ncbi:MAG TPA: FlgD immunoglobulin-like domain containing protein, partial [Candidatus Eisenbacteria bacterium]
FLTSCRQTTSGTTPCWPCPSNAAEMSANWATAAGFLTGTYGSLYPIQDYTQATGVPQEDPSALRPYTNALSQNRPNPFNPETVIPYTLAGPGRVTIRIFDVSGRLVRTLVDGNQAAGPHIARWDGKAERGGPLASGIYFYAIVYPDGATSARKMTILR